MNSTFLAKLIVVQSILGTLAVSAGTIADAQSGWYKKYQKQANAPDPAKMLLNKDKEPELKEGFVDLFNGKDLSGWTPKGGKGSFEAKEGMIVGMAVPGTPSTYLCTDKVDYADFIFTWDMKWEENLNSGVMFRAADRKKGNHVEVYGPQVEMEGFGKDRFWSGESTGNHAAGTSILSGSRNMKRPVVPLKKRAGIVSPSKPKAKS